MQCIADNLSLRCSVHHGMRTTPGMKVSMRKILKDGEKMFFFIVLILALDMVTLKIFLTLT